MRVVYLAGPMSGLTPENAYKSRVEIVRAVGNKLIEFRDPMRGMECLVRNKPIAQMDAEVAGDSPVNVLVTPHGIVTRDFNDVNNSDLVVVDLRNTSRVSIVSVCEIAWAWQLRKPIVVVMNKDSMHDHAFVRGMTPFVFSDNQLTEAATVACSLLNI